MSDNRVLIGDTRKVKWISSGASATAIHFAVYNGAETLVDSATMTDSGNGHYYGWHTIPNTPGYYVVQTTATVGGRPFKNRFRYLAMLEDVN